MSSTELPDLDALASGLLGRAPSDADIEVAVGWGRSTTVKAYNQEVEELISAESYGVSVRVIRDGRVGFAHAGSIDEEILVETLDEAAANVEFGEPDEFAGLAEPDGVEAVPIDHWNEAIVNLDPARKIELALALERATAGAHEHVTGVRTATFGDSASQIAVASSRGLRAFSRGTSAYLSVSALATDGEQTQIAGWHDVSRDPDTLDPEEVGAIAADRAVRMLGAAQAATQKVSLLLEPQMAATLLGIVAGTLTGDRVVKGRSPFAERVGQQVASPLLSFADDPTDGRSIGADAWDGEGLACRPNPLVDAGVLQGFLHDSYTGRRSGSGSTGSAVRGSRSMPTPGVQVMVVEPGIGSHDELRAGIEQGLLVQSMAGLHSGVNPVSGDFSVGAEGLMIRNGELAEPVREVTIASTLQRLLLDISAVGADQEWLPSGSGVPSIVIGDVSLSGS
ncbi:MAG: TldD/PmbA family protein [Actinomycetia bacterium]|nr:TldD/PmbA family protein [Actinomycetes bacterium]